MIAEVVLWSNGMVMSFDEKGQQIPDFQGRLMDVRQRTLAAAGPDTKFILAIWRGRNLGQISRAEFAAFRYDHAAPAYRDTPSTPQQRWQGLADSSGELVYVVDPRVTKNPRPHAAEGCVMEYAIVESQAEAWQKVGSIVVEPSMR